MRECLWHPSKQVIALVLVAIALWAVPFLLLSLRVVLFAPPLRVEKNALLRAVVSRSLKCQSESQSVESEALSARLSQLYFKIIIMIMLLIYCIFILIFDILLLLSLCTLASVHTQT